MRILATLVLVVAIAAGLRFPSLSEQSYSADEAATVQVIDRDFNDVFVEVLKSESTPPLYYTLAWPWIKIFGTSEAALRSLSAIFGTATVLVAFAVGRRAAGPRVGVNAAALVAVNPLLIWYSQEARAYALLVLLGSLSFLFFLHALAAPTAKTVAAWSF